MTMYGNRTGTRLFGVLLWVVLLSAVPTVPPAAAGTGSATETLKTALNRFIEVLTDPSFETADKQEERRGILHELFLKSFDEMAFVQSALGPHWEKRTDSERSEFRTLFIELLEQTYVDKIDYYLKKNKDFTSDDISYVKEKTGTSYTVVMTRIAVDSQTIIPVYYKMKSNGESWLINDVAIEGVSLLKNYRVQFNEIIANDSFEKLLTILRSKKGAVSESGSS